jgi:hypothetical protein
MMEKNKFADKKNKNDDAFKKNEKEAEYRW